MRPEELKEVPLFADLSPNDLAGIAAVMRGQEHARGAVLVEEGDIPTKFFVLLSGHATVHREGRWVADLGPGDFFGEVGILALAPRNASVIATTPGSTAVTMGWELRRVLDESPTLGALVQGVAAARSRPG